MPNKNRWLRFASEEEKEWMNNILQRYVREHFHVAYFNRKPLTGKEQKLYRKFKELDEVTKDYFIYTESRTKYYVNSFLADVRFKFDKEASTIENPIGVSIQILKIHFKEWLEKNNIHKPKFPKAKLIR